MQKGNARSAGNPANVCGEIEEWVDNGFWSGDVCAPNASDIADGDDTLSLINNAAANVIPLSTTRAMGTASAVTTCAAGWLQRA
jgi:hypothetical protein